MAVHVNIDNFRTAETARMLDDSAKLMGGWNRWIRLREPTALDQQPVIRTEELLAARHERAQLRRAVCLGLLAVRDQNPQHTDRWDRRRPPKIS